MFLEIILFTFFGIAMGTVTGLVPGLHPNTLFVLIISISGVLAQFPIFAVLAFITSLAVTNTFTDFIPSILMGAPSEDTALSILPGHRMVLEGKGYEALMLTVLGGIGVVALTLVSFPILIYFIPAIYSTINPVIQYILLLVVLWMILTERGVKKLFSLTIFILVGLFGVISLNIIPSQTAIFPALSGLFGFSALITSLLEKTTIPKQKDSCEVKFRIKGIIIGWLSALLVGILPGIGPAQASVIAAKAFKARIDDFLTAVGGINTANILFTFIVFYTLLKTRSGASLAVSQIVNGITMEGMGIVIIVGTISSLIGAVITLKIGKLVVRKIGDVNYPKFTICIIIVLIILVFIFTGFVGLFISLIGTFIGMTTVFMKIKRSHLMGYLIFPTILYFSGLNPLFLHLLGI